MTDAATRLLEQVEQPPADERAEFADRLLESLADEVPFELTQAQLAEVQRRVAQVEAGEATLIPGEEAEARIDKLIAS